MRRSKKPLTSCMGAGNASNISGANGHLKDWNSRPTRVSAWLDMDKQLYDVRARPQALTNHSGSPDAYYVVQLRWWTVEEASGACPHIACCLASHLPVKRVAVCPKPHRVSVLCLPRVRRFAEELIGPVVRLIGKTPVDSLPSRPSGIARLECSFPPRDVVQCPTKP